MKISIEKNLIHKSLSHVQSIVEKKNTIPILSNILLDLNSADLILMDESEFYPKDHKGEINSDDWGKIMKNIIEIQTLVENEYGLKVHFHPHVGTFIEYENQIDKLLNDTNISLCFDTGHHAFWNQDPLSYLNKVIDS